MKMRGHQRRNRSQLYARSSFQLSSIHLFTSLFAVLLLQHPYMVVKGQGTTKSVDVKKVEEYIKHHNNTFMDVFTYEQLKKWFEAKADAYKPKWGYPRLFPFCVTRNQIVQGHKEIPIQSDENKKKPIRVPLGSHLYNFERYFHGIQYMDKKFYHFEFEKDHMLGHQYKFVKEITFSRINTPEPDMVNLRQWAHITVKMRHPTVGLYLQSIVGPLGLPFGEFSVEFPCKDDMKNTADIDTVGQLAYCSHRPKANIYHPSVYVGYDEKRPRTEFHVHFRWFDLACMETPYVQFLMLIVKNKSVNPKYGVDYVAQLSTAFMHLSFDRHSGSRCILEFHTAYPYYPGFKNSTWCFLKNQDELKSEYGKISTKISTKPDSDHTLDLEGLKWESTVFFRIQPNEEYDQCILYDESSKATKPSSRDDENFECGPVRGPFRCDVDLSILYGNNGHKVKAEREKLLQKEFMISECYPCGVPECTKIGFDPEACGVVLPTVATTLRPIVESEPEANVLSVLDDNILVRAHGVAAMLSFLIFIPLAHFVGRFYKEVMGKCFCDNGPWIFVHLLCSMLAISALWASVGLLIPTWGNIWSRQRACKMRFSDTSDAYEECMGGNRISSPHTITGLIVCLLVHIVPISGFSRPSSSKTRFIITAIHSHMGYFTYFLGVVSVFLVILKPRCKDTLILCVIIIVLPIIFSVIAAVLDMLSDKSLDIIPGRKQWPVLEEVQLESRGPFEIPKLIILAIFVVLMMLVWVLAWVSLNKVTRSGDDLIDGENDLSGKPSTYLGKLQGLFGACGDSGASGG